MLNGRLGKQLTGLPTPGQGYETRRCPGCPDQVMSASDGLSAARLAGRAEATGCPGSR